MKIRNSEPIPIIHQLGAANMNILITGASGFIGEQLIRHLSGQHQLIGMSRSPVKGNAAAVRGCFDRFEDLSMLDRYRIDAVVHLAAVTGGCSEEDALAVNVQGTRRLFRYLLDRGCRRFVAASSIAAVGSLDSAFVPRQLPMPDDYAFEGTDAYGWSKWLVEQLCRYLHRQTSDADFVSLRFGSVEPDHWEPPHVDTHSDLSIPFVQLGKVYASDVVGGIASVLESPGRPRAAVYNLVGPDIGSGIPAAQMLQAWLKSHPAQLHLDYYAQPGHEFKPLYDMERMKSDFGFTPARSTRRAT